MKYSISWNKPRINDQNIIALHMYISGSFAKKWMHLHTEPNAVVQQPIRGKAYCAYLSLCGLRCWSACAGVSIIFWKKIIFMLNNKFIISVLSLLRRLVELFQQRCCTIEITQQRVKDELNENEKW
ncbi:UNVERIFIED_CONTAM: hypothetical protein NCL1_55517 [Trichonephila clavipes]